MDSISEWLQGMGSGIHAKQRMCQVCLAFKVWRNPLCFQNYSSKSSTAEVCTRYRTGPILPLMYRSLRKSGNTKSVNYHQSGYLILPLLKCNIEIPNARKVGQALQSHRRNIDLEIKHSLERRTWNMRMTASSVLGYIIPKPPHNMLGD